MRQYQEVLKKILIEGDVTFEPRTQMHTLGISSAVMDYDLREGFPLSTTKRVPPRLPFEELFWKLRGERNVKGLFDRDIHIWDGNAYDMYLRRNGLTKEFPKHSQQWNEGFAEYQRRLKDEEGFAEREGDLGPVYGFQWRHWRSVDDFGNVSETDQLTDLLKGIPENPGSRYHILNAWNSGDRPRMAIGACPYWHQFTIAGDNIDLTMVQRSNDYFLGNPFNDAQDSCLLHLVAKEFGLKPRFFHHHTINTHIYLGVSPRADFWKDGSKVSEFRRKLSGIQERGNFLELRDWYLNVAHVESSGNERKDHIPFVLEQLSKEPRELPRIVVKDDAPPLLDAIKRPALEIFEVKNYNPHKWDAKAVMAA